MKDNQPKSSKQLEDKKKKLKDLKDRYFKSRVITWKRFTD